jgi:hypothetical protein
MKSKGFTLIELLDLSGKIGLSTKCCINGKEYMEVHSFPKDAKNPEITNIEWE